MIALAQCASKQKLSTLRRTAATAATVVQSPVAHEWVRDTPPLSWWKGRKKVQKLWSIFSQNMVKNHSYLKIAKNNGFWPYFVKILTKVSELFSIFSPTQGRCARLVLSGTGWYTYLWQSIKNYVVLFISWVLGDETKLFFDNGP